MEKNVVKEFDKLISDETIVNINRKKKYNDILDELEEENENLASNMPWNTTEQATEIQVTDAAKYSKNKLELFGNTEQIQYTGKNLYDYENSTNTQTYNTNAVKENNGFRGGWGYRINLSQPILAGTYTFSIEVDGDSNSSNANIKLLDENKTTISNTSMNAHHSNNISFTTTQDIHYIQVDNGNSTNTVLIYNIQIEEGAEATDYEPYVGGQSSPNQDYPQDIHIVSGVPYIYHTGKNLAKFLTGSRNWRTTTTSIIGNRYKIIKPSGDGLSESSVVRRIPLIAKAGEELTFSLFYVKGKMSSYENNYYFRNIFRLYYTDGTFTDIELNFNRLSYQNKLHISRITLAKDVHLCRFLNFIPGKSFSLSVPLEYDIQIQKNGTTDYTDYIGKIYALNLTKNEFNKNNMTIINGYIGESNIILKSNFSDRITAVRCKPNTTYIIKKIYETSRFGVATYNEENLPVATTAQTSYPVQNIVKDNESMYLEITTDADSKWLLIYYAQFNDDNTQILRNAAIDTLQVYEKNSGIEMLKIGDSEDKFEFRDGQWVIPNKIKKIDSYNGEEITTDYISTTGGLDVGATVYYVGNEDYVIEDSELINELNELSKLKTNKDVNNIDIINKTYPLDITDDKTLKPYMQLSYMQDLPSKLDKLEAMVIENS